jgi:hypothetical protein
MARFYPALIYGGVGFSPLIPLEEKIRALPGWDKKLVFCFFLLYNFRSFAFLVWLFVCFFCVINLFIF